MNKEGVMVTRYLYLLDTKKATAEELEAFKDAQGEFYAEDETTGKPLWFSNKFAGNDVKLSISQKGNVYADNTESDIIVGLSKEHGISIKDAMDLYKLMGAPKAVAAKVEEPVDEPAKVEEPVDEPAKVEEPVDEPAE